MKVQKIYTHLLVLSFGAEWSSKDGRRESPPNAEESDLVVLDATLMLALQTPKDRAFILDIEALVLSFLSSPLYPISPSNPSISQMCRPVTELEPINSYYRLLVHRVARFYGLEHTVEPARPAILILSKTLETKVYPKPTSIRNPETHLRHVTLYGCLGR